MELIDNLSRVKDDIERLYKDNPFMSPYQSYDFLSITGKGMTDKQPWLTLFMRELNAVCRDNNGHVIVVAPMLYQRKSDGCHVWLRGVWTSAGHLDFVYNPEQYSYEIFSEIIDETVKKLGKCFFHFTKIHEKSLTVKHIERKFHGVYEKRIEECASIVLPETYDAWFSSLKKSAKQNVRTAYNRMNREGLSFEFIFRDNEPMKDEEYKEMIGLYSQRLAQKNSLKERAIILHILKFLKTINPMTKALQNMKNTSCGIIRINKEIAGCFWGVSSNDRRLIIPRLSINNKYGVYCPGGLLIAEAIKKLIELDGKYTEFDLSCGDEPYKYVYGADPHYNYSYDVKPLSNKMDR